MRNRTKTRNKGIKKQEWYSICSKHSYYEPTCDMCKTGSWEYIWAMRFERIIHAISPNLWLWYVNKCYTKKINMKKIKYTVWVERVIEAENLSKKAARQIAKEWKSKGYDVFIDPPLKN